jgi:phosphatidylglycerophosphatase A
MTESATASNANHTTNGTSRAETGVASELGFEDRFADWISTWFGCGYARRAPGTVGSLGAVPLHWALSRLPIVPHAAAVLALSALGTWAAGRRAQRLGEKDPQSIVIDEVTGTLIALGLVRRKGLAAQFAALALFRVLDITKPGLIDRAQHTKSVGLGIMADDWLAGAIAGGVVRALIRKG